MVAQFEEIKSARSKITMAREALRAVVDDRLAELDATLPAPQERVRVESIQARYRVMHQNPATGLSLL